VQAEAQILVETDEQIGFTLRLEERVHHAHFTFVVGALAGHRLLAAMGASPEVIAIGGRFPRIMLGGSVTVILLFMINAAFRGAGDPAIAMRTLWLANGINIVLGPVLVFGVGPFPAMGVTGAAIATTIGRGIGVVYQVCALAAGRGHLAVRREHLRFDRAVQATILRLSGTGIFQILIATTSWVGLTVVVTGFGSLAVAGYGIATRIVMFALMPSFGMANAAATLVGQNLGAGRPERAEQAVWRASFYNLIFRRSVGRHVITVCDSVSCWIMGGERICEHLQERLGIGLGETTADNRFTLLPTVCLGCCDHAPAMMVAGELHSDLAPDKIDRELERYK